MLNKEICYQCHEKNVRRSPYLRIIEDTIIASFHDRWKEGKCFCKVAGHTSWYVPVDAPPPDKCPYALEHLLVNQEDEK